MGRRGGWSYQPAATKAKKRTKRSGGFRSLNPRNWSAKRFEEEFPGIFENDDKKDISPSDADELTKLLASGPEELCDTTIVPASSSITKNNLPSPASTVATTASKTPSPPPAKVIVQQKAQAPKPRSTPPRPSNLPDFQEEHLGDFERQMREKYGRR